VAGLDRVWSEREVIAKAVAGSADRSATWGRANLKLERERNLPVLGIEPGQVPEFLETLTDRALASVGVVQVARPARPGPGRGRRLAPDDGRRGCSALTLAAGHALGLTHAALSRTGGQSETVMWRAQFGLGPMCRLGEWPNDYVTIDVTQRARPHAERAPGGPPVNLMTSPGLW
jgi:hypothetical protein